MSNDDFRHYLKSLRIQKGLSIRQLSLYSGVSNGHLSQIEAGTRGTPKPDVLIKISQGLKIPYRELMIAAGYIDENKPRTNSKIPIGEITEIPIIGTVKAGPNELAYQEHLGFEKVEEDDIKGGYYFYLKVKGDSMESEGILEGDLVLVKEQPNIEYGELAVVIVNGEEGTLKRVYKKENSIVLQASNPQYPPRIFAGQEMEQIHIVGKVKGLKRNF